MYGNARRDPPFRELPPVPINMESGRGAGYIGGTNNIRRVFLSVVELLYDSCFELTYKIQKRKERDVIVRRGVRDRWEYRRRGDIPPR